MNRKKIVVFGGSGFLGQALCQAASAKGFAVTSISRSGQPKSNVYLSNSNLAFVNWVKADLFTTTNWQDEIQDAFAVIDLIGILKEQPKKGITYQKFIEDAANRIGKAATEVRSLQHFVFLSANSGPKHYLQAKRNAENALIALHLPLTIVRPGLLVGKGRPSSIPLKWILTLLEKLPFSKKLVAPIQPLDVDLVAKKIVTSLYETKPVTTNFLTIQQLKTDEKKTR